jgi:glycosyltransferase involved in cell wall biosynthesis
VYDIDDDVLTGGGCLPFRKHLDRLQNPGESAWLAQHASRVITGNGALAERCTAFNQAVVTIPTVVDCRRYWRADAAGRRAEDQPLCLVWVGQRSTLPYLITILPHLQRAASLPELRKFGLVLRIVCDGIDGIDVEAFAPLRMDFVTWSLDGEVDSLVGAHVGLMPLADDVWCRGKCGYKAIQCMAMGIPAIVSPVGVNALIVEHAVNGYHAREANDWVRGIEMLALQEPLRREMGRRAGQRIQTDYSLQRWAAEWSRQVTGGVA